MVLLGPSRILGALALAHAALLAPGAVLADATCSSGAADGSGGGGGGDDDGGRCSAADAEYEEPVYTDPRSMFADVFGEGTLEGLVDMLPDQLKTEEGWNQVNDVLNNVDFVPADETISRNPMGELFQELMDPDREKSEDVLEDVLGVMQAHAEKMERFQREAEERNPGMLTAKKEAEQWVQNYFGISDEEVQKAEDLDWEEALANMMPEVGDDDDLGDVLGKLMGKIGERIENSDWFDPLNEKGAAAGDKAAAAATASEEEDEEEEDDIEEDDIEEDDEASTRDDL